MCVGETCQDGTGRMSRSARKLLGRTHAGARQTRTQVVGRSPVEFGRRLARAGGSQSSLVARHPRKSSGDCL